MRLSKQQKADILQAFETLLSFEYDLYLIGSRTKNHLKGGDIDLLVITHDSSIEPFQLIKHKLTNEIMKKKSIDDTRVDITCGTADDLETDPFISTLNEQKIKLN